MRFQKLIGILVGLILTVILSVILDWGLGLVGFPAESIQIAHPPNFTETRTNLEFSYSFQTNSRGIRYPEIPLSKAPGERRLVVIGDSFTEGWGVEAEQTFTTLLENNLSTTDKSIRFINCGLSGTAPLQYARILFHVCLDYQPEGVLIVLYANDVVGTPTGAVPEQIDKIETERKGMDKFLHTFWPRTYTIITDFMNRPNKETDIIAETSALAREQDIPEEEIADWVDSLPPEVVTAANTNEFNGYILTRGLLQPDHWVQSLAIESEEAESRYEAMINILNATIARCRAENIAVGVILIPAPFQHSPNYGDIWSQTGTEIRTEWLTEPTELERRLVRWSADQAVPYLDLTPFFRSITQTSPGILYNYPLDGHWTAEAHAAAAEEMIAWLSTWYFQQ